jgi:hypothetical protein
MDDLRTQALLVDFDPTRVGTGAIGTVISRDEVAETAARGEFPATLLLELDQVDAAGAGEVTAHATVAVDWDENTLGQLLDSTDDDEIALWFDERELAQAFDEPDVEAHGFRQRAAVLAIAVTAAGVSTTPAFARFAADTDGGGGGGVAAAPVAQPSGAERGLQMDRQVAVTPTSSGTAVESTTTSSGGSTLSDGEVAVIAGSLVILAAGFGVAHRRKPPVQPA